MRPRLTAPVPPGRTALRPAAPLEDEAFGRTSCLTQRLAGIALHARHRELLARRGLRAGVAGAEGWTQLLDDVEAGGTAAAQRLLGLVTTQHTGFFRHPEHFDLAAAHVLRVAETRAMARAWSAATATGEEAWSLAMVMAEAFPAPPPVEILATDILEAALTTAARAEYGETALQPLGPGRCRRFAAEAAGPGRRRLAPELRRLVSFRTLNLATAAWPVAGPFDVIFCRNVLMYLGADHRHAVLERLASLLAADGLLMLDPAEHPGPAGHWFSCRAAGVYARRRGHPRLTLP